MLCNVMQRAEKQSTSCARMRCHPDASQPPGTSTDWLHSMQPTGQSQTRFCTSPLPGVNRGLWSSSGPLVKSVRRTQLLAGLKLGVLLAAMVGRVQAVSPIPAGLTELSTADGQQMLRNSTPNDQFWLLAQEFTTQDSQDWCGLASASMVLNALPIPKPAIDAFEG